MHSAPEFAWRILVWMEKQMAGSLWDVGLGVRKLTSQRDALAELSSFLLMACDFFLGMCYICKMF